MFFPAKVSDFIADCNQVFSELAKVTPRYQELSDQINALLLKKQTEHNVLSAEWRELNEFPPGRDEGALFLNQYLDFIEETSLKRLKENMGRYVASRKNMNHLEGVRQNANIAHDPANRHWIGLDMFLLQTMRDNIPMLLEKLDWPETRLTNVERLARMDELNEGMGVLHKEIESLKERLTAFGITPK
ncbi:MAG: hypothetical protein LAE24_00240 [Candidatus Contendobacter sp.]|nr:hypothetical protein [Candidatus Contendobacter sp.]